MFDDDVPFLRVCSAWTNDFSCLLLSSFVSVVEFGFTVWSRVLVVEFSTKTTFSLPTLSSYLPFEVLIQNLK